jgi:hypothetical protein
MIHAAAFSTKTVPARVAEGGVDAYRPGRSGIRHLDGEAATVFHDHVRRQHTALRI